MDQLTTSKSRAAGPTILGYLYQFDKTIVEILHANDTTKIHVEHIEDVNLDGPNVSTAIQCKYIASKRYSSSLIRDAVKLMLEDFLLRGGNIQYQLYAYFKDSVQGEHQFTIADIRKLFTFKRDGKTTGYFIEISDEKVTTFLDKFTLIFGKTYQEQQAEIITILQKYYGCDATEADIHYYNNALRVIESLSIQKEGKNRSITKKQFLQEIDHKSYLFSNWYCQLKGKVQYLKLLKKDIGDSRALMPKKNILLFLGAEHLKPIKGRLGVTTFIENLVDKHYKEGKSLRDATPWTVVLDFNKSDIRKVKESLLQKNINFNDGYEEIEFNPQLFDTAPVVNHHGDILTKASYRTRLVSGINYLKHLRRLRTPDSVFFCSTKTIPQVFLKDNITVFQVPLEDLKDISSLLIK